MKSSEKLQIKVGIVQPNTIQMDLDQNSVQSIRLIRTVAKKGAQIICTPECMLDGYSFEKPEFQAHPEKYCVPLSSPYCGQFQKLAQELHLYLILGLSLQEAPQIRRNAALLITPGGEIQGYYSKIHSTLKNMEAIFYAHGTDYPIFPIRINNIDIKIGIMICYDRQMPECARNLAIHGAEIIFNPAATGNFRAAWNTHLIQTRAYENKVYIVSVNHAWPRINGLSFITSPNGKVIKRLPPWQSIGVQTLNIDEVRKKRKDLHTRRPSTYQGLLDPTL